METKDYSPQNLGQWLSLALRGAFVGVGGILPGVSGGVLCVAFGLYKPLMEVLANPIKGLKQHYKMFIPFIIGGVLGFVSLAKAIGILLEQESTIVISVFIGLILGVFPALFREAGQEGRSKKDWMALACSSVFLTTFFLVLKYVQQISITPNTAWFVFSGALFGVGVIVPGMSSSSLLMFLGLYQPMSQGIGELNFSILIPVGIGGVATVLLLARGVQKLFEKHYAFTFHCIIGFVIASTIPIVPLEFISITELVLSLGLGAVACVFAYGMDKWGTKIRPPEEKGEKEENESKTLQPDQKESVEEKTVVENEEKIEENNEKKIEENNQDKSD